MARRGEVVGMDGQGQPLDEDAISPPTDACQIATLPHLSQGRAPFGRASLYRRARLMIRRRLPMQFQNKLRQQVIRVSRVGSSTPAALSAPAIEPAFDSGDLVRVRSQEEIGATLDHYARLRGCAFMPE